MPTIKQITGLIKKRDVLIAAIITVLNDKIDIAQESLLALVITGIVDGLDKKDDVISNTAANRSRILLMERIYNQFAKDKGLEVVAAVADGASRILQFNAEYFQLIGPDVDLIPFDKQVKTTISNWLGLTDRNTVARGGYLDSLIKDTVVKQQVKDALINATITQKGFFETRDNIKALITGTPEKDGLLASRFSQIAYDHVSKIDRTVSKMYGDKMKLPVAIFSGPVVKASRAWCIARKGKVFTQREIAAFNPPTAKPINYEPFTDLGGINCVDHLNFISYSIGKALRPDLPPLDECYI